MPTDHRGNPVGDNHLTTLRTIMRVSYKQNRFTRPVADSQGRPYPSMTSTGGDEYPHWYADAAARDEFLSHERIPGTVKPIKGSDLSQSIDRVGPMYSPTIYNPANETQYQGQVGHWTKWGARRAARQMMQVADNPLARATKVYSKDEIDKLTNPNTNLYGDM